MSKIRVKSTAAGEQARSWRETVKLTVQDLADLTGYSPAAIYLFERGGNGSGDATISEWSWQRYRLCCGAIAHQLRTGKEFAW